MPSFDNRHAKRGRLMMLLLFHDVNIGFPLVLTVLEAFYEVLYHKGFCFYLLSFLNQLILLTFIFLSKFILVKINLSPKSEVVVSFYSCHSTNKS